MGYFNLTEPVEPTEFSRRSLVDCIDIEVAWYLYCKLCYTYDERLYN